MKRQSTLSPIVLASVSFAVALLAQGCGLVYTPSLAAVCEPVIDDSYVGVWKGIPNADQPPPGEHAKTELHITRSGDWYTLRCITPGIPDETRKAQLFRVGKYTVAEVTVSRETGDDQYLLAAVANRSDSLGIRWLSADWADDHLVANRHTITCEVRSSPQQLVKAIEEAELGAFSDLAVCYVKQTNK